MTAPLPLGSAAPAGKKTAGLTLPSKIKPALLTVGTFGLILVIIQIVNSLMHYRLDQDFGIESRAVRGLDGVLAAPLLHASWAHLTSNIVPLLIFGFLILVGGVRRFVAVTALVWLVAGLGVWLVGPANTVTIGASGLVFGWLAYLVVRGIFNRSLGQIGIGILLLAVWGGVFWTGIVKVALNDIPGVRQATNISWQGHLFGAVGGVLAAMLVARADGPRRSRSKAAVGT